MSFPKLDEYNAVKDYASYILGYVNYCGNPNEYIKQEKKTLFDNLKIETGNIPEDIEHVINLFDIQNQKLQTEMQSPSRFSESIGKLWAKVVNPQIRIKGSTNFLVNFLLDGYGLFIPDDLAILDVAGGLGIESSVLQGLGYKVVYNEPGLYLYNTAIKELSHLGTIEKIKYEDLDINNFKWDNKLASKFFDVPYPFDFISKYPKRYGIVNPLLMLNYSILLLENWFYGEKRFKVLLES